jgi:uncharacterized hydrophobic protein (TIGR00271 family)
MGVLRNFVDDNQFKANELSDLKHKLYFEGSKRRVDLERYVALLILSTAIATYGVVGDSVATVIGAMIIAPLMRPIMAITAGTVMGDFRRAGRSLAVAFISVVGVIGFSWLLAELHVGTVPIVSFQSNSQIASRVSPRIIDLMAALWSGAAGAFAMSREDVSDTLPGAAIAISLVPPLCVVGIGLAEAQWGAAGGAMLLFATNFLSILLAGSAVLALLGLHKAAAKDLAPNRRRNTYVLIALAVILVLIPLTTTSVSIFQERMLARETTRLAYEWLVDTDYGVRRVDVDEDEVVLEISGSGDRPELSELGKRLNALRAQPTNVRLIVTPSEREQYVPSLE